jgi:NhaA family Na+:H+ antiporter
MTTNALLHAPVAARRSWHPGALFRFTIDHFLLLPLGGLIAIVWANLWPERYFTVAHDLAFIVNEIGMALFFALVAQEVVEEVMPGGALHTWRRWTLPVAAAVGAIVGSALVYLVYVEWKYELVLSDGWPVAGAVDLAFAYFIVRAIFGRHPAIPFVLLLAITADVIGMLVIASRHPFVEIRPGGTALMAAALGLALALRRRKVRTFWPYLLACGPLSWWALYLDGLHPALALVPIVPFLPHAPRSLELFTDAPHGRHDSSRHFEHVWKYPIQGVLFLFGLVNAGVLLTGYDTGTWALLAAALVGKPLGIVAAVGLALALGLHMPARFHWRDLVVIAFATCGGFTFGLFFATAVFPMGPVLAQLKIGALATGIGVPLTFGIAWFLHSGRFSHRARPRTTSPLQRRGHVHHAGAQT